MKKILYFSAAWCGPCKNFKPIMEHVSRELPVQFVDVDTNPDLVAEYGVRNIPAIVITRDDRAVAKQAGVLTESQIKSLWNQN